MLKVIKSGEIFKIKEVDDKGNSVHVDERNFATEGEALKEIERMQAPSENTEEKAQESAPTAPSNEPQTDDPAARGAVDEGQSPAAPENQQSEPASEGDKPKEGEAATA